MAKEILPAGEYTIKTVGPHREWDFNGNDGAKVSMVTDSLQFEGHENYWIDLNRPAKNDPPKEGDTVKGHAEQDDGGKYAPKFVKEKTGGGSWRGGNSAASPGAVWSAAVQTASTIVAGYYNASDKKPKDLQEFFGKVELIAPKVNALVDKLVANAKPAAAPLAAATNNEAGESPAPAEATDKKGTVVDDISDEDLDNEEW